MPKYEVCVDYTAVWSEVHVLEFEHADEAWDAAPNPGLTYTGVLVAVEVWGVKEAE